MRNSLLVLFIVFLLLSCSMFVLADPPHKDKPVKKPHPHDNPPLVNNISWYGVGFGFFVVLYNNSSSIGWSDWSSWWTLWNVLSDPPVISEGVWSVWSGFWLIDYNLEVDDIGYCKVVKVRW